MLLINSIILFVYLVPGSNSSLNQPDVNEIVLEIQNVSNESGLFLKYADRISNMKRGATVQWYVDKKAPRCKPLYEAFGGIEKMRELGIKYLHVFEPLPNGYYSWPVDLNDQESVDLTY